ncbi:MAG: sugar ABC transporter permease [Treponema sp.]|jgi:raffinose/stachyose/melibiose transport system permease protein|nr:sugar ABC transporter permease [Treponema sp.]
MKKNSLSDSLTYVGFTIIPLALYGVFYIFQVLSGMFYSFTDWNGMGAGYNMVGFRNYLLLFRNPSFWRSLGTTFRYALLLVAGTMILSLFLALALDSLKIFKTFAKAVFFIPAMLGSVTVALIWSQLYYRAVPLIGQALNVGFLKSSPLAAPQSTMLATVFVNIWQSVAIPTIIFIAGLQTVPRELYESAMMDGASPLQRFRFITIPGILPIFIVNLVLLVKAGFTTFDYPYALTGGGPARATEVISISIINDAFRDYRFSIANAEAAVLFIIIASISLVQIRFSSRGGGQ